MTRIEKWKTYREEIFCKSQNKKVLDEQNVKLIKYKNLINKINPNILDVIENNVKINSFSSCDISQKTSQNFIEATIKKINISKLDEINNEFEKLKLSYEEKKNSECINEKGIISEKWINSYSEYQKFSANTLHPFTNAKHRFDASDFSMDVDANINVKLPELTTYSEKDNHKKTNLRKVYLTVFVLLWLFVLVCIFLSVYDEILVSLKK